MLSFCEDNLHIHNDKKHLHKQAYNPSLFPSLLLLLFATACCLLSLPLSHLTASPPIPTSSSHTHVHLVAIYHPRSLLLTSRPTTKPVPLETSIHQGSPWTATIMKPHTPQNPLDPVFLLLPPTLIPLSQIARIPLTEYLTASPSAGGLLLFLLVSHVPAQCIYKPSFMLLSASHVAGIIPLWWITHVCTN